VPSLTRQQKKEQLDEILSDLEGLKASGKCENEYALEENISDFSECESLEFPSLAPDENKFSPVGSLGNIKFFRKIFGLQVNPFSFSYLTVLPLPKPNQKHFS